jgi:hypothetical protein
MILDLEQFVVDHHQQVRQDRHLILETALFYKHLDGHKGAPQTKCQTCREHSLAIENPIAEQARHANRARWVAEHPEAHAREQAALREIAAAAMAAKKVVVNAPDRATKTAEMADILAQARALGA